MSREEEQFNILKDGIILHLTEKQFDELCDYYTPKYNNSDVSRYKDIDDYSEADQDSALEDVKDNLVEQLRAIFDDNNKALIMLEKIIDNYSGK